MRFDVQCHSVSSIFAQAESPYDFLLVRSKLYLTPLSIDVATVTIHGHSIESPSFPIVT